MVVGGQAGVSRCGLLHHTVQPPRAPPGGTWPQQLQEFGVSESVCHPPRSHHLHHAGRLLLRLLLFLHRPLPGVSHGWVSALCAGAGFIQSAYNIVVGNNSSKA